MNKKYDGENLLDLDELFQEDAVTPAATNSQLNLTEAMSKRINEVRAKTEAEVRDKIAKDLGFDNYEAMESAKDKKLISEAGYDPAEIEKIIEPLLEKRLASDPRMQKLQQYEEREKKSYITDQLAEIEKLTGVKVAESDLSKDTLDLWGKGVDLSKAYIATNSIKIISASTKGSTDHLASSASSSKIQLRGLTSDEKALYRSINPDITEEELNKKTLEVI